MYFIFMFSVTYFAISCNSVEAATNQEILNIVAFISPELSACTQEQSVAVEEMVKSGKLESIDPCVLACTLKRIEIMDKDGMISRDKTLELANKFLGEDDLKKVPAVVDKCVKVNDIEVSDGSKGCERMKHLMECGLPVLSSFFPAAGA